MNRTWDVVVVGARVAGAAVARLLAGAGLAVLCVERSPHGSDTLSTHGLMRGGVIQLARWQLLESLHAAGTPAIRRTVFHYGADDVAVSIRAAGGVDALYAPRRTVLDPILVDAATKAGAQFEFSGHVTGLTRDHAGTVTGVVITERGRRSSRVERAHLVVGADGRNSLVAAAAGAQTTAAGRHAGEYLYGYWADLPSDGYEWFYSSRLAAGMIPTNDHQVCVFVGGSPSRLRAEGKGSAEATFDRLAWTIGLADRLGPATLVGSIRHVRNLPPGYLRQAYGPGWALVGDAGHWLDPISTHGMTGALRDAALLSAAVLAKDRRELSAELADFQAERDRLSMPMLRLTDQIACYAWDLGQIRDLLRSMASAMADEVEALADQAAVA